MKNTFLFIAIILLFSSCINEKRIARWLEKHPTIKITGDTTYIEIPMERVVTIELPPKTIVQKINCDDFVKPLIITDDSTGLQLKIEKVDSSATSNTLQVTAIQQPKTITQTIRDTIEVPVAIEYHPDILRYQIQADSLQAIIATKDKEIKRLSSTKRKSIRTIVENAIHYAFLVGGVFICLFILRYIANKRKD